MEAALLMLFPKARSNKVTKERRGGEGKSVIWALQREISDYRLCDRVLSPQAASMWSLPLPFLTYSFFLPSLSPSLHFPFLKQFVENVRNIVVSAEDICINPTRSLLSGSLEFR